jgi:HK97 gp10 family phage protein
VNELQGVKECAEKMSKLKLATQKNDLRAAMRAGIKPALDRARATIPVGHRAHKSEKKGALLAPGFASRHVKTSISVKFNGTDGIARLGVAPAAFYAVQFLERGTEKMAAHPWLRPAFEQTLEAQQAALAGKLKELIEGASK